MYVSLIAYKYIYNILLKHLKLSYIFYIIYLNLLVSTWVLDSGFKYNFTQDYMFCDCCTVWGCVFHYPINNCLHFSISITYSSSRGISDWGLWGGGESLDT